MHMHYPLILSFLLRKIPLDFLKSFYSIAITQYSRLTTLMALVISLVRPSYKPSRPVRDGSYNSLRSTGLLADLYVMVDNHTHSCVARSLNLTPPS
jgi:hypothetical protein